MKKCSKCKVLKSLNLFGIDNKAKDNRRSQCTECCNIASVKYKRTRVGLLSQMYYSQIRHSKTRKHAPPTYTKQELGVWLFSQENFNEIYESWVLSGYKKDLIPSIDRYDDYKPYSFNNIQLSVWNKNKSKGEKDRLNGVNNKVSKAVIGTHRYTGEVIEFHSMMEAERVTGIFRPNISSCCKGDKRHPHAGDYKWKFKEEI